MINKLKILEAIYYPIWDIKNCLQCYLNYNKI